MLDVSPNLAAGVGVSAHCAETLRTLCGDSDPCAVVELNNLEPAFFPHPCAETPTHAETPTRAETRILTVSWYTRTTYQVQRSDASLEIS